MRKLLIITTASVALLSLSACTFQEYEKPGSTEVVAVENKNHFSHVDSMFTESMVEHHEGAVAMSELALTNTTNPAVLEIANNIIKAQKSEIAMMKSWLSDNKDMGNHGMKMDSMGMMSDEEMGKLQNAKDAEFDKLYLLGMIVHHEGAIVMAKNVVNSNNTEVADFANNVIKVQSAEIEKMKSLL